MTKTIAGQFTLCLSVYIASSAAVHANCENQIQAVCNTLSATYERTLPVPECIRRWQSVVAQGGQAVVNELNTNSAQTAGPEPWQRTMYHNYRNDTDIIMPLQNCALTSSSPTIAAATKNPAPTEEHRKRARCSEPPAFSMKASVDDGLDAAGAPALQGVSYCMAYVSSDSDYPLNCSLRGRHSTIYPHQADHLVEGWPMAAGETCEAKIVCVKETRFPALLARYCPAN